MSDLYGVSRRRLIGESSFWIAIVLGFVVLLIILGLVWRYAIAGPTGAVGAREIQQGAVNRVQKQEQFEQLAADYDGYVVKIGFAKEAVASASAEDKSQRETELVGMRQVCVDAVQQFNAESRKYSSRVWKSAGLPERLDPQGCS